VVEVDADADDCGERDPAQPGQQVQPGVEPGQQADGDREQEMLFRVDRDSPAGGFERGCIVSFA
jgi:hypothetical protein